MSARIPETMRAVVLTGRTRAEDVRPSEVPVPAVRPGWVLVRVFGLNHSEQILRQGEIDEPYIQKPVIPGIDPMDLGTLVPVRDACLSEIGDVGTGSTVAAAATAVSGE